MKIIFVLVISFLTTAGVTQTLISGKVADEKNVPVPGANIMILNTYDGASSDKEGKFQFSTNEAGRQTIQISFIGYKAFILETEIAGKPIVINTQLKEEINQLQAVTITAGSFTASDESRRTTFRAVDIATTAGATADIAGALNTLPGTQKVGESGRLFVRGGDEYETKTFIDGMAVLDAYSPSAPNAPSRGRFLPFMFKGTSFSTGGYSAEYGQALSSALILTSRDKAEMTRTDIGVMSVGADVAHTQAWGNASMAGKIQYTNLRPYNNLISQEIDWVEAPASVEAIGAYCQKTGDDGMIKVYGNFNRSNFSLYHHDIADPSVRSRYELTNNYRYLNGSYLDGLSENWTIRGGFSFTSIENERALETGNIEEEEKGVHAKIVAEHSVSEKTEIKFGIEHLFRSYDHVDKAAGLRNRFQQPLSAIFFESDLYASNRFVTRVGLRTEHVGIVNQFSIDPRFSMAYKIGGKGQISLAYGTFRQTAKNQYLRVNEGLGPEKAGHYILNYQLIDDDRTFRVEVFYKDYKGLVKFKNLNPLDLNNSGNGYSKGFELFWRDNQTIRNVDYWISYSFLDTKRDHLNFPMKATPSFATTHNFSTVYKHFISKIKSQAGFTWSFTSGRPYENPNTEGFNNQRTPAYIDLSLNWAYLYRPYVILYFSCTNLLGRDNIFGYEFSSQPDANGIYASRGIRQPAPRFIFIGLFITLSKEKTVNQLPSL